MYQIMLVEDEALVRESMAQNTNWEKFGFAPPHVFLRTEGHPLSRARLSAQAGQPEGI